MGVFVVQEQAHFAVKPGGEVFGGGVDRIERRNIVEIEMIQPVSDRLGRFFHIFEIGHHAHLVKLAAGDFDFNLPVVAVHPRTVAGIVVELVCSRKFSEDFKGVLSGHDVLRVAIGVNGKGGIPA